MVEYEDHRLVKRHVVETRDFDAPKVDPERKSHEGNNDAANHICILCFVLCTWMRAKYQVPSTKSKYQVPSTKYQVPSTKYQVPSTKNNAHTCTENRFDAIIPMLSHLIQNPFA